MGQLVPAMGEFGNDQQKSDMGEMKMKYYAVFLPVISIEKSQQFRPQHLEYLDKLRDEGRIFANGKFSDGSGGLVIYIAESTDEAIELARRDPFVANGARGYEIHEWEMVTKAVLPQ